MNGIFKFAFTIIYFNHNVSLYIPLVFILKLFYEYNTTWRGKNPSFSEKYFKVNQDNGGFQKII